MNKILVCLVLLASSCRPVWAQNITTVRIASGFANPDYVGSPPGDMSRLFVIEQKTGLIRIYRSGSILPTPFLNVKSLLHPNGGERGLLGMAFHPDYFSNGYFYINYVDLQGFPVLVRYQVSAIPDVANPSTATVIAGPITHLQDNHNGGAPVFGPDGYLYWGMGDGGGQDDAGIGHPPEGNGQNGQTLLGKILRLDVDAPAPYIPPSNPFVGNPNFRDEIWAYGLRNPYSLHFDRLTGDLFIGDVGQDDWEEINVQDGDSLGGENYGWKCMEGNHCTNFPGNPCVCNSVGLVDPLDEFPHLTGGCSGAVVGGVIYRGCQIPSLWGHYLYTDYCSGRIWSFTYEDGIKGPTIDRTAQLAPGGGLAISRVSYIGEDASGEILLVDRQDGEVYQIVSSDPIATPYCVAKTNSLGCIPAIAGVGTPSASSPTGFVVSANNVLNNKSGLLFYSLAGQAATPFQGGTLCVKAPIKRTPGIGSGGTPLPAADCTGVFQIDMNSFTQGGLGGNPDPSLQVPGTQVNAQFWGRDPGYAAPNNTQLSNALNWVQCQ